MNVYDFDNTIFQGDSTLAFYCFCLRKQPSLLGCLPKQGLGLILYLLHRIDKTSFKEQFFLYLKNVNDLDTLLEEFWTKNRGRIRLWYLAQKKIDDIVISASPEFLLEPICRELGIDYLIASKVDPQSGLFDGTNCKGKEKVLRFKKQFPDAQIDEFYSDSDADIHLAMLAKKSFWVKGNKIIPWKRE